MVTYKFFEQIFNIVLDIFLSLFHWNLYTITQKYTIMSEKNRINLNQFQKELRELDSYIYQIVWINLLCIISLLTVLIWSNEIISSFQSLEDIFHPFYIQIIWLFVIIISVFILMIFRYFNYDFFQKQNHNYEKIERELNLLTMVKKKLDNNKVKIRTKHKDIVNEECDEDSIGVETQELIYLMQSLKKPLKYFQMYKKIHYGFLFCSIITLIWSVEISLLTLYDNNNLPPKTEIISVIFPLLILQFIFTIILDLFVYYLVILKQSRDNIDNITNLIINQLLTEIYAWDTISETDNLNNNILKIDTFLRRTLIINESDIDSDFYLGDFFISIKTIETIEKILVFSQNGLKQFRLLTKNETTAQNYTYIIQVMDHIQEITRYLLSEYRAKKRDIIDKIKWGVPVLLSIISIVKSFFF